MVLLGAASGEAEAQLSAQRLRGAGINARVSNAGDSAYYTTSYAFEFWVRPKEEERAREVLGL